MFKDKQQKQYNKWTGNKNNITIALFFIFIDSDENNL